MKVKVFRIDVDDAFQKAYFVEGKTAKGAIGNLLNLKPWLNRANVKGAVVTSL